MSASSERHATVYAFMVIDGSAESERMASFKATRQAIRERFRGRILEGTAQVVEIDELDADGCLQRLPTGWGDL
jgi:hypothetical protein